MSDPEAPYHLRSLQPGDLGWIIHRHGVLYAAEFGWGERFEALVAQIASEIVFNFDATKERCWLAERDGKIPGSVFLVRGEGSVAKLRLLLVEPSARGLGVGTRLVREAVDFARECGYTLVKLWTHRELVAAQHIYKKLGFRLTEEEPHAEWGVPVIGQKWELNFLAGSGN